MYFADQRLATQWTHDAPSTKRVSQHTEQLWAETSAFNYHGRIACHYHWRLGKAQCLRQCGRDAIRGYVKEAELDVSFLWTLKEGNEEVRSEVEERKVKKREEQV